MHLEALAEPTLRVLRRLSGTSVTGRFCLGGGTGLALHLGHRLSVDLDWFTQEPFDPFVLRTEFPSELPCEVTGTSTNTLQARLDGVKVDCLRYAYPLLTTPVMWEGVRVLSIPDIAAMKLSAVANRGAKKDFFDIARLLAEHPLPELLAWYEQKFAGFLTFSVIRSLTCVKKSIAKAVASL